MSSFPNFDVFLTLMIVITSMNSVDPDEMSHNGHFIWVLTVKYPFRGFQYTNRVKEMQF